ncbi:MAG: phosphopantothenate--cysteine ligase [Clostridia bacterium]|nr:phosphopantothenate--cysteine ligase [Clostridia bacterium]
MNIIITAGGTSEKIDTVRKITNSSSGKLGQTIANNLLQNLKNLEKIYYISAKNSQKPTKNPKIKEIIVTSCESLYEKMQEILTTKNIDIVIHSMAVSDYTVDFVSSCEIFAEQLQSKTSKQIVDILNSDNLKIDNTNKISSYSNNLLIKLVPTKKIISYIKKWSPNTTLFGFKLLSNTSTENLINVGYNLLEKNNCDYVIANDLSNIKNDYHLAYIIDKNKNIIEAQNNQEIADLIYKKIINNKK